MKKYLLPLSFIFFTLFAVSCNKDWTDEQYEQYVSIVAPMNTDSYTPIYLRYTGGGKATYELPIEVTGSTNNIADRDVYLQEDLDTLNDMNVARFGLYRKDLYFKAYDKSKYKLPEVVKIPKGESKAIANIEFDLNGIDMNEKWVVPLSLVSDDSYNYVPHPRKNYSEAILKINPFNDFSGAYSTSTQTVTLVDENDIAIGDAMTTDKRTAYVVDENTIFFYAGLMNEELEDRHKYKIKVRFLNPGTEDASLKKIEVFCDNAEDIDFKLHTTPEELKYSTAVIDDSVYPYLEHHYVTINIDYSFNDISSSKDSNGNVVPIRYRATGVMILERNINTLIPDQDQAIQW